MASPQADRFAARMRQFAVDAAEAPPGPEGFRGSAAGLFESFGVHFPLVLTEHQVNQTKAVFADEPGVPAPERVLLFLHGGSFICGSASTHARYAVQLGRRIGARAVLVDYRLAPEHQHPAQINDCADVYEWLLGQGTASERIAIAGESAGGNLTISAQLEALRRGLPAPAATYTMSPWLDFEALSESYVTNAAKDACSSAETTRGICTMYFGEEGDRRSPRVSPLYADLSGLSPLFVQVGGDEVLLDDSRALVERARRYGVTAELDVVPDMQHMFQFDAGVMPEANAAYDRGAAFLNRYLAV